MTIDVVRTICRAFPGVTEDIKWGSDLVFSVGGKMFVVVNTERPHELKFKCTPETFAELIERDGIIPAPYMARAMWVEECSVGEVFERREMEALIKTSYELVAAKLPKSRRPTAEGRSPSRTRPSKRSRGGARRSGRRGR